MSSRNGSVSLCVGGLHRVYIGFTYPGCKFGIQVAFQRRAVTSDHPRSFETARCQDVLEDYIGFT